ncbi:3-keto-5-aminohexanoate cleavage protein [Pseudonocardia asaccharolytica]|uniref:3-keto-5-aminohexanoate cleavage protein n=1 Tax=Pseudonocardia asaccharolytica DSM 44247 = NBRC 16224 TaxID=1123024 RepID=A0A511D766_9PSEU|nr:3-keto-5-aminohexanoate cleavage protein [Pseudonocardia asaccharolytica]GEL20629.1 3-keto-5-aminohexanoate cleavage protein [Pseudonocardia asaccharolytica DSM 44247 = NBRC 16224]
MSQPSTLPSLWDAAREEMEGYAFHAQPTVQPPWEVPERIAINVAVAGRAGAGSAPDHPVDLEEYVDAASQVIEAGACGVHIDFTWVTDSMGRRLDKDLPPTETYGLVLEPLRARFGDAFVANLNVLNGATFEECLSPAVAGQAEVAPCAAGHPEAFVKPAVATLLEHGVSPEIVIHSSGEVELAKRRLFDPGILTGPRTNWIVLYGLPVDAGRTLISGAWVNDTRSMATHLFLMVDQIRQLDPDAAITVCNAGRAGLYITTLATMMGLNIRVGLEDSLWKHPNADEINKSNLELFSRARTIAQELGRQPATADEYRAMIGLPRRG